VNLLNTLLLLPPPRSFEQPQLVPVLLKLKQSYLIWFEIYQKLPKTHRYSIGQKIDTLFIDAMEAISVATFLNKTEKQPWIRLAIRKVDTVKLLLMILWESKTLEDKKYIEISVVLNEVGKMLGGWNGQIEKQNQFR